MNDSHRDCFKAMMSPKTCPSHAPTSCVLAARKSSPSFPLRRASVMLLPQQLPCCR